MVDANGQRFWMLSGRQDWLAGEPAGLDYDAQHRRLHLASGRLRPLWPNQWSLRVAIVPEPGDLEGEPIESNAFSFTAQRPTSRNPQTQAPQAVKLVGLVPATPRASENPTDLQLQVRGMGSVALAANITLGFPDGRYTTRSARLEPALEPETPESVQTLVMPVILNQPGAWSLRLTLADGRQSDAYHFTVLSAIASALEISGLESITAADTSAFQRLIFTGQGFVPGMQGRLSLPGDSLALTSGDLQAISDTRLALFISLGQTASQVALRLLEAVPPAQDAFGTTARWDAESNRVVAQGASSERSGPEGSGPEGSSSTEIGIYLPPAAHRPTDLAMGYDGILYGVMHNPGENTGQVVMVDRRDRWLPFSVPLPAGFVPWRLAAHPQGGVWVLDRANPAEPTGPRQLVRIQGEPLPTYAAQAYTADTFRPSEENPYPPQARRLWSGRLVTDLAGESSAVEPGSPEASGSNERAVAIATSPEGELALLTWVTDDGAYLRLWQGNRWQRPYRLEGADRPFSVKWLTGRQVALLLPGLTREAVVYALPDLEAAQTVEAATEEAAELSSVGAALGADPSRQSPQALRPSGGFYPLRQYSGGHFYNGITQPPTYPTPAGPRPLYPLSTRAFAPSGATSPQFLDSRNTQTLWHRLYLEAVIPPKCGIRVFLAASDEPVPPAADWFEHRFGQRFAPGRSLVGDPPFERQIPLGTWVPQPSEVPFHPGLLGCPPQKPQQGLFTALIQRGGRKVRSLQGRYLWVRLELKGDGHNTPEVAALRAYGSRFSYLNQYLPALYQESVFGPEADEAGTSSPADFLERFLDNFEGILTPLEDRIAHADLLTDARTVPADALDWLGSWVGVSFEPACPVARRRRLLAATPTLYRQRGTLNGLKHALDLGTDGGVRGGEIIVLEDFRLRRTFATILGANLAEEATNPLTAGLAVSGNSFVGDTLVLGDETQREFLALFQADLPLNASDRAAVAAFFDRLAYRVTVYVHNDMTPQDLGLIRRIVELESPAHVLSRVVTTTAPFLVTLSALVSLDTYLRPERQRETVTLDRSHLGLYDVLRQPASLDPRLTGSFNSDLRYPVARAGVAGSPQVGESFLLDGSDSEAFAGRRIDRFRWTLRGEEEEPP